MPHHGNHCQPSTLRHHSDRGYQHLHNACVNGCNGSFTLTETDSDTDSDLDSKPNGYIVLCRTCSHCTDSDSDPYSLFLHRIGIWVLVHICIRVRQCKWATMWVGMGAQRCKGSAGKGPSIVSNKTHPHPNPYFAPDMFHHDNYKILT